MILKNSLYTIVAKNDTEKGIVFRIRLNSEHTIYKAHFPGQPITPGVCITQIAKELIEEHRNESLEIKTIKNIKFLSIISPDDVTEIDYNITSIKEEEDAVKSQISVTSGDVVYAKISLVCQKQ